MNRNRSKVIFNLSAAIAAFSLFVSGFAISAGQPAHALGLSAVTLEIQPLAANGDSFHYYASGKRIDLKPSLAWVAVKFADANPAAHADALKSSEAPLNATGSTRSIPVAGWALVPVNGGTTQAALLQGINAMRAMPTRFSEVNPVFQAGTEEMVVTDEFIASFDPGESMAQIDATNAMYGVEVVQPILGQPNTFLLKLSADSHMDALAMSNLYQDGGAALTAAPNFLRITPASNAPASAGTMASLTSSAITTWTPNDYWYHDQWTLNNVGQYGTWTTPNEDIDAPEAWGITTGSSSVVIAVVDSGVELTQEDLSGKLVSGFDATVGGPSGANGSPCTAPCPNYDDARGTVIAGIAAASTNNSIGVTGVCPGCMIMPVRIGYSDPTNGWTTSDVWAANGITWAYQHNAAVIVGAWQFGSDSTTLDTAIANATSLGRSGLGTVVVFAAGDNNSGVSYPASLSATTYGVISVGALNLCNAREQPVATDPCDGGPTPTAPNWVLWGGNSGPQLTLTAPAILMDVTDRMGTAGYNTNSGSSGNYYVFFGSTDGAAAMVSGVAGLVLSVKSSLSATNVKSVLQSTAVDVPPAGFDNDSGFGRVNAHNALKAVINPMIGSSWVGGATFTADRNVVAVGSPNIGGQVMAYDSFTAGSTSMYVPMLFNQAFGGSYNAALYIQNVDPSNSANITISYYDTSGNLTCTHTDTVPKLSSHGYWIPSECVPPGWVGSATITSSRNIVAIGRPHIGAEITSYDGFAAGSTSMYVPMLFNQAFGGSYDAALYVQNVDPSNSANITISYYDTSGNLTCTHSDSIPKLSSHGYWIPFECVPPGWVGSATITSNRNIVAIGRPHIGTQVTAYDGFSGGTLSASVPMLYGNVNGGTNVSALYIQDLDPANSASVTLKFYNRSGDLSCTLTDTIPSLSSHGYWLPSQGCLPVGWMGGVVITSNHNIVAVGRPQLGSEVFAYSGFAGGATGQHLPMLFANAWTVYNSGYYLMNLDASNNANVTVEYHDTNGNLSLTTTTSLAPLAAQYIWVPDVLTP